MAKLFDMVAATSAASMMAAAIAMPGNENKDGPVVGSETLLEMLETYGPEIYYERSISSGLLGIMIFFSILIGLEIGLEFGEKWYSNRHRDEAIYLIKQYIKGQKRKLKVHD